MAMVQKSLQCISGADLGLRKGGGHKAIEAAKQPRIFSARSAEKIFDIYISQEALHLHILNTASVAVLELLASSFHWDFI